MGGLKVVAKDTKFDMVQDILFRGYTTTPPELISPDGELFYSEGLSNDGSGLVPVLPPSEKGKLNPNDDILYVHQVPGQKNAIVWSGGALFWLPYPELHLSSERRVPLNVSTDGVKQVLSVGNVLILLSENGGMEYVLWSMGGYKVLGSRLPEVRLKFGLKSNWVYRTMSPQLNLGASGFDHAMAEAVKMISEEGEQKGKLIYPFFIRYALRLYDGSLVHHSAPILMLTTSGGMPIISRDGDNMMCLTHSLHLSSAEGATELEQWSDVVKSVDIFISKPVSTFDQNGKEYFVYPSGAAPKWGVGIYSPDRGNSSRWVSLLHDPGLTQLPKYDEKYLGEQLSQTSNFYFLTSITATELKVAGKVANGLLMKDIAIPKDYLHTLVNREVMTDDYDSHDIMLPNVGFAFNSRLNVSGLKKRLFHGFGWERGYDGFFGEKVYDMHIDYYIREGGKEFAFEVNCGQVTSSEILPYLYHPNRNVYRAVVTARNLDTNVYRMDVEMSGHPFLNGSYAWLGFDCNIKNETLFKSGGQTISGTDDVVELVGKLYTSQVNNPFFFEAKSVNTIGGGEILGLSAAVKALSEGQYGQFPVYAFTTEGVWALQTLQNGSLSSKQPVSRDVCTNPNSITQIDDAVLFVSERGLMLLSGSRCVCISDVIFSRKKGGLSGLPKLDLLLQQPKKEGVEPENKPLPEVKPLQEYLQKARILYDYVNQRIIVFNPSVGSAEERAYVYSLTSKHWSFIPHNLVKSVALYPYALGLDRNGRLLDYGTPKVYADETTPANGVNNRVTLKPDASGKPAVATPITTSGWFVTRALKLGAAELLKTIRTIIIRGSFERGAVRVMLWGSRDLKHWFAIAASADDVVRGISGTPYKYFRVGVRCDLSAEDYVTGCSIEFEPRHRDRLR